MSIFYQVDTAKNQVFAFLREGLRGEDIVGFTADVIKDQRILPGFRLLFDATCIDQVCVSSLAIHYLLEMESLFPNKFVDSKRVYLFKSAQHSWWLSELDACTLGCSFVCYRRSDAHAWLALQ